MKLRNMLAAAAAAVATFGILLPVAPAVADPVDPHMPDAQAGRCRSDERPDYNRGYCDGEPYPDGTFWRWSPSPGALYCVVDKGPPAPKLAEPGGCGGGWHG